MEWLSAISFLIGLITFVFSLIEYFKTWKKYFLYGTCLSIGFTIGIIASMSAQSIQQFNRFEVIYLIAFLSIVGFLVFFVHRFLTTTYDTIAATIILIALVGYLAMELLNSVASSQNLFNNDDFLILAKHYEEKGQYSRAADFLERYKDIKGENFSIANSKAINKKINLMYEKSICDTLK